MNITFVHVLPLLVLTSHNGAVFGNSAYGHEAIKSGVTQQFSGDFDEMKNTENSAVTGKWSENRGKCDFHSRKERSVVSDTGYGSRLDAGHNVVNDYLQKSLFAQLGKRAVYDSDYDIPSAHRFLAKYGFGSRLSAGDSLASKLRNGGTAKRVAIDYGYGSRIRAAANLAKNHGVLFGNFGPGKRSVEDVPGDDERFERYVRNSCPGMGVDSGYGSRVSAGGQLADDFVTMSDLFGLHGPGKR